MNFKIPGIITGVFAILLLLINIIVGNPINIIILRVVLSAILIYGIIFVVIYVFKSVLKIDLTPPPVMKSSGEKVDYVVDDNMEQTEQEHQASGLENNIPGDDLEEDKHEQSEDMRDSGSSDEISENEAGDENRHEELEELESSGESPDDTADMMDEFDASDYSDSEDAAGENEEMYQQEASISVDADGDTIKEKLGVDASFEDLAKAIRTKLKRDVQ